MTDEPKKPLPTIKPVAVPTLTDVEKHIAAIKSHVMPFLGKIGHNPHLWLNKNLTPLTSQLKPGVVDVALFNKILAIKIEDPKI